MKSGELDVKIIARSDREARVIIANKTGAAGERETARSLCGRAGRSPSSAAVAADRAAAAMGGGGGGGQQSSGGGMGGGGGGMGGGGGGGMFSIPPDETGKIEVARSASTTDSRIHRRRSRTRSCRPIRT